MTLNIEDNVGIDPQSELYVIKTGNGFSTWGWNVVKDRCERMALNLVIEDFVAPATGTREAWDTHQNLLGALKKRYDDTGEKTVFDLTMDLMGLEGHRVEVVDHEGDAPRRFIVGRSTGWSPVHLEIKTIRSTGGEPARREYHSVRDLGLTNR
jgi:hypothetical protein